MLCRTCAVAAGARQRGSDAWLRPVYCSLFAPEVYKLQLGACRHFMHEHPATATSWKEPVVERLRRDPPVSEVVGEECRYGLTTLGPGRRRMPALRPTHFLSSSPVTWTV